MARRSFFVTAFWAFILIFSAGAAAADEPLRYELHFERPSTHLLDITIHARGLSGANVDFAMPDWAPGSYYIENYAANVQGFHAAGPDGRNLEWHKTDSQTWRIGTGGAKSVIIHYQLFGNTLANNQAQYNERHAFIGGPAVWMYLVGGKSLPIELSIAVPAGWKVATGLTRKTENIFAAENYDWFADCPLEISDFAEKKFQVSGTTYHVIVHDIIGGKDFSKFADDLQKIVERIVPIFGSVAGGARPAPFDEYWFLFHVWPKAGGGLEHLKSTQINFQTDWDSNELIGDYGTQYELKLYVTAHEFFHAWNVKRLRPRPLGPFDYTQMVYTPSLWISEGLTSYYGALALVRAGLVKPERYLEAMGKLITRFEQEPGRAERSIEDTSWDTWFRNLQQQTNLKNTWYSYYDGGQIVGHLLDFAIRQSTNNRKSPDDWMRLLYSRYALPKPGFEPDDAVRAASEVAGTDMSEFFRRYISGTEPLPYAKYFAYAGIAVEAKYDRDKPWLGVDTKKSDEGRARISSVIPSSPAEAAGLDRDDVILAVDGRGVDADGFSKAIGERKPGDRVRLTILRLGHILDATAELVPNPYPTYSLKPMENPSELQKQIYRSWLGIN